MNKSNLISDERILNIIFNKEKISNSELYKLLFKLLDSGDNYNSHDSLIKYCHIDSSTYDSKMIQIIQFICSLHDMMNFDVFECKNITKDTIKNMVDVLPEFRLIQFIEASVTNFFVVVDYEYFDNVIACDSLLDILEKTFFKDIINDNDLISNDDINDIIKFIWNLDLFDIELYNLHNR